MVDQETVEELHCRYLAGETAVELAAEVNRSIAWLYGRFRAADLKRLPAGKRVIQVDDERAQQAIAMWMSGTGSKQTAERMHMGHSTLARLLREAGCDPRERCFGPYHHSWKDGRVGHASGYAMIRVDPDGPYRSMINHKGHYVMEHRLVMAEHLGRPLRRDETVHHVNGIRNDNRLENLQLRSSQHGQGAVMRCADCGSNNLEPEGLQDRSQPLK